MSARPRAEVVESGTSQVDAKVRLADEIGVEDEAIGVRPDALEEIRELPSGEGLLEADRRPIGREGGFEQEGVRGRVVIKTGEVEQQRDKHLVRAQRVAIKARRQ